MRMIDLRAGTHLGLVHQLDVLQIKPEFLVLL